MSWELSSSFRRAFTTSTLHQLIFKTKFKEFKNLTLLEIIALTITKTNVKRLVVLHVKDGVVHRSNQGKYNVRQCCQRIVQKYHTTYIFISSKILFLIT